jgi:hypothetical protein
VIRGAPALLAAAGFISLATAVARLGDLPERVYAATPQAVGEGRIWLVATSALVADKPEYASILGFTAVGLVALALCGPRVVWAAGAIGHLASAALVYGALDAVRALHAGVFESAQAVPDFGTSAVIAAWIGVCACAIWLRGLRALAVTLCVVAGALGWLAKGQVTILDSEHGVALAIGIGAVLLARRSFPVRARLPVALRRPARRDVVSFENR